MAAPLYAFGGPTALFFTTAALTAGALYTGVRLSHEAVPAERRAVVGHVAGNTGRVPVSA